MNIEGDTPSFYCQICGIPFVPNNCFGYGGRVCGKECNEEYGWVKTLMILKKKYYMDPRRSTYTETINDTPSIGSEVAFIKRWGTKEEIFGTYTANGFETKDKVYGHSMDVVRWRLQ